MGQNQKWRKLVFIAAGLLMAVSPRFALAAPTYSSPSYGVDQVEFGTGGENNLSSAHYGAQASVGDLGDGDSSSANYRANAGFLTQDQPFIELGITAASVDLGVLTTATTGTGSGTFYVRSYLSNSYTVLTMSPPPTSEGGHILAGMGTTGASSPGTEQFGINLVANTSPATFGAAAVNTPSNSFADGQAATNYDTANQFRYVAGETIASAPKTAGNQGIGRTDYTISYIANIAPLTPAGYYTMGHDLVAVGSY